MNATRKMLTGLIVMVWMMGLSGPVEAELKQGPWPVDPELAQVEEEMKEKEQACAKLKNPMAKSMCKQKVSHPYFTKGLVRGIANYVDRVYVGLETPDLEAKLKELQGLRTRARTKFDAQFDRVPGEISDEDLTSEIRFVQMELGRRAGVQYEKNRDFLQGKGGTTIP